MRCPRRSNLLASRSRGTLRLRDERLLPRSTSRPLFVPLAMPTLTFLYLFSLLSSGRRRARCVTRTIVVDRSRKSRWWAERGSRSCGGGVARGATATPRGSARAGQRSGPPAAYPASFRLLRLAVAGATAISFAPLGRSTIEVFLMLRVPTPQLSRTLSQRGEARCPSAEWSRALRPRRPRARRRATLLDARCSAAFVLNSLNLNPTRIVTSVL